MNYKLVISDIDGTLLDNEYRLHSATQKTIRDLVASGVMFATASARTIPYTLAAINGLMDICCANAYLSGAYVETSKGEVLVDKPIFKEETAFLVEQLNKSKASFCCVSRNHTIGKLNHPEVERNFKTFSGVYTDISSIDISQFETYFILACGENLDSVKDAAKQIPDLDTNFFKTAFSNGIQVLDLIKQDANKGSALANIIEYYNIDVSQTIAIGDSVMNDGPMIEAAGLGVAMKNAHQKISDKADKITAKDNNNDGAGDFLRSFFGL